MGVGIEFRVYGGAGNLAVYDWNIRPLNTVLTSPDITSISYKTFIYPPKATISVETKFQIFQPNLLPSRGALCHEQFALCHLEQAPSIVSQDHTTQKENRKSRMLYLD
jgi:hypothetical protein